MANEIHKTAGTSAGTHITGTPLTTTLAREVAPGLLRNEIDNRVARIRPMATPVDQISRMIGARKADSMIVDYYSIDTKQPGSVFNGAPSEGETVYPNGSKVYSGSTLNNTLFAESDTLLVPGISGYDPSGTQRSGSLMLYVTSVAADGSGFSFILVNGPASGFNVSGLSGKKVIRMGRAAGELDVQTAQFEALPVRSTNYCQIFKAQVEQSHIMRASAKEVGWSFLDQEEVAVTDMRMCMEKSFVFGCKTRMTLPGRTDEVMTTEGIWNQTVRSIGYSAETFGNAALTSIMRAAFSGTAAGSRRKILFAGSGLIEALSNLEAVRAISARDRVTRWGIDFNEIVSKFGSLMVVHAEVFDQCGHDNDGLIVDPEFMTKYVHVPFKADRIDMKRNGSRNTEAVVITEASCLVLRNREAHLRIVCED